MNDDLMRRISDAIDRGGVASDPGLAGELANDAAAARYADDLAAIGAALGSLGQAPLADLDNKDWDALSATIDARLDEPLGDLDVDGPDVDGPDVDGPDVDGPDVDGTGAPVFFGDDAAGESGADVSGPVVARPALVVAVQPAAAVSAVQKRGEVSTSNVVDLASRRRKRTIFATIGGLAAAAAVGLGITAGLTTMGDNASEMAPATGSFFAPEESAEQEMAPADTADEAMAAMDPREMPSPVAAEPAYDRLIEEEDEPLAVGGRRARSSGAPGATRGGLGDDMFGAERGVGGGAGGGVGGAREEAPSFDTAATAGPMAQATPRSAPRRRRARPARPAPDYESPPSPAATRTPTRPGNAEPTRADSQNRLHTALANVRRCMPDHTQVARVRVTVRGSDGAITQITLYPPFAGTAAGHCIERSVRRVRMPTSARESYRATHVYQPAPVAGGSVLSPAPAARQQRRSAPVQALEADWNRTLVR